MKDKQPSAAALAAARRIQKIWLDNTPNLIGWAPPISINDMAKLIDEEMAAERREREVERSGN